MTPKNKNAGGKGPAATPKGGGKPPKGKPPTATQKQADGKKKKPVGTNPG